MDQGLNDPLTPRETWDGPSQSWASAPPEPSCFHDPGHRPLSSATCPVSQEDLEARPQAALSLLWPRAHAPSRARGSPAVQLEKCPKPRGTACGARSPVHAVAPFPLGSMAPRVPCPLPGSLCLWAQP